MKNILKSNLIRIWIKEIPSTIIVVTAVFHENNKYDSQVFLDEYLYKL